MISETIFEINEELNKEEMALLNDLFINKLENFAPKKVRNIENKEIDLNYNFDNKEYIFKLSNDLEYCDNFIFENKIGHFSIKHFNESYSFLINSFILCIKSIAPLKVNIQKGEQNWDSVSLFTYQLLKNTEISFYDIEYVVINEDTFIHLSKNINEVAYTYSPNYHPEHYHEDEDEEGNYES